MRLNFAMAWKWLLLFTLSLVLPYANPAKGGRLVVASDKAHCPDAKFTRIQDAIDAADSGDLISICKGLYAEQLTIGKSLDIDADSGAILLPGLMRPNTTSLFDGSAITAAILVADAGDVSISGLTFDGSNNAISQCAPDLVGIMFRNASGKISTSTVQNFRLASDLDGCQSGTGIFVQSGGGQISNVEIEDCSVHDFQKNGITGNEVGTTVSITKNVITGIGPTTGAAQNGIQIGFGAQGAISDNHVTNNLWSPCTAVQTCRAVATNILVFQSDGVTVSKNHAGLAQVPIFIAANDAHLHGNDAFAASVFDDLRIEGNGVDVRHNRTFNGAESSVFVMGNNNVVKDNHFTEAPIGILEASGSVGNSFSGNHFHDIAIPIQDPLSAPLASQVQPQR